MTGIKSGSSSRIERHHRWKVHSHNRLYAFDKRVTFWLQHAQSLPCDHVFAALFTSRLRYSHYTIAQAYTPANTQTYKAVTEGLEAKKLVSCQRQLDYNITLHCGENVLITFCCKSTLITKFQVKINLQFMLHNSAANQCNTSTKGP